jgi:hypothetical protein
MIEDQICILLDPDLREPLEDLAREWGVRDADEVVNAALRLWIDAVRGSIEAGEDLRHEHEILRIRIQDLEQKIRKKDEVISVLLKLWEQCPLYEGEREVPPELEEKISRLLQNWYYDSERKDFSGADGGSHG